MPRFSVIWVLLSSQADVILFSQEIHEAESTVSRDGCRKADQEISFLVHLWVPPIWSLLCLIEHP